MIAEEFILYLHTFKAQRVIPPQIISGSAKTRNGMEQNGTNRGSRKLENLRLNSCTPFLIVTQ